jgi:hypothetical protein
VRKFISRSITTVSAAIEQISSGQIGHPAACIIESNQALSCGCPGTAVSSAARGLWLAKGLASATNLWHAGSNSQDRQKVERVVHQRRGQLCGQPPFAAAANEDRRASRRIAESLSNIKVFQINHLHHRGAAFRGISPRRASIGAAVELSARAGPRSADE